MIRFRKTLVTTFAGIAWFLTIFAIYTFMAMVVFRQDFNYIELMLGTVIASCVILLGEVYAISRETRR